MGGEELVQLAQPRPSSPVINHSQTVPHMATHATRSTSSTRQPQFAPKRCTAGVPICEQCHALGSGIYQNVTVRGFRFGRARFETDERRHLTIVLGMSQETSHQHHYTSDTTDKPWQPSPCHVCLAALQLLLAEPPKAQACARTSHLQPHWWLVICPRISQHPC